MSRLGPGRGLSQGPAYAPPRQDRAPRAVGVERRAVHRPSRRTRSATAVLQFGEPSSRPPRSGRSRSSGRSGRTSHWADYSESRALRTGRRNASFARALRDSSMRLTTLLLAFILGLERQRRPPNRRPRPPTTTARGAGPAAAARTVIWLRDDTRKNPEMLGYLGAETPTRTHCWPTPSRCRRRSTGNRRA